MTAPQRVTGSFASGSFDGPETIPVSPVTYHSSRSTSPLSPHPNMRTAYRLVRVSLSMLLVSLPAMLPAQVTTRTLAKPESEFAEPFSAIVGIRELRDGRVLVADNRDCLLYTSPSPRD